MVALAVVCASPTALLANELTPKKLVWLHGNDARGRPFDLTSVRGQVVAITFASRYTREEADRVNSAFIGHAALGEVVVVNIVDLTGVPSLFHGYARRKVAEHDQRGRILHIVDEHGEVRRSFQADPQKRVDILVIDRAGLLRGRFVGLAQVADALKLVDALRGADGNRPPPIPVTDQ